MFFGLGTTSQQSVLSHSHKADSSLSFQPSSAQNRYWQFSILVLLPALIGIIVKLN